MLTFGIQMDSTMRFLVNRRAPLELRRAAVSSLHLAMSEYLTNRLPAGGVRGIGQRFGALAFAIYGFQPRSSSYEANQRQDPKLRGPQAYISPRHLSLKDRAALAKGAGSLAGSVATGGLSTAQMSQIAELLAKLARFSRPHMRELITKPGTGHRIDVNQGISRVSVQLPAAKILNRTKKYHDYGAEFRDLTRGGARDLRAILGRASALFDLQMARRRAA